MSEDTHYELSYNSEGISITQYDLSEEQAIVLDEWWYTWTELFTKLTGEENHAPDIV